MPALFLFFAKSDPYTVSPWFFASSFTVSTASWTAVCATVVTFWVRSWAASWACAASLSRVCAHELMLLVGFRYGEA